MQVEVDKLEWEVKHEKAVKNSLNAQLVDKIRECEELKSEVARLNNLILTMEIVQ